MSLIDASFIGRSSSLELAALGPATAISDSASLPLLFLSIAATNLIAKSFADEDTDSLARISRTTLGMGATSGVLLAILLYTFVNPISLLYCGSSTGGLLTPCAQYVAIRTIALPCAVIAAIAQAICIGTKDTKTPMISVALAAAVNLAGDFILVTRLRMGMRGAAWATAISQLACTALLLRNLNERGFLRKRETHGGGREGTVRTGRQVLSFVPFLYVMLVKIGLHNSCAATAASLGGARAAAETALAAIGMLCFTFGDVGSSLSQAFLPAFVGRSDAGSDGFDIDAAMPTIKQLLKITIGISTTVVCLASTIIGVFGGQITGDPAVLREMRKTLPWMATALTFHGSAVTLEGLLLARKKFRGLTVWYTVLALTIVAFQVCTRRWGLGLAGVWGCYVWVSVSRVVTFSILGGLFRPRRWWLMLHERIILKHSKAGIV